MTNGQARQITLRGKIQAEGLYNGHARHDQDLCDYADAAARAVYEQLLIEIPKMIQMELNKRSMQVTVDTKSLNNVKSQVMNAIKSAFK